MIEDVEVLKIIKEDILRVLGEQKGKKISLESITSKVNVADQFIFRAVKELERRNLIKHNDNFISLTKRGEENAKDIVKRHIVIEDYFKRTKNETEAHKVANILEHYVSKEVIDNIKKLSTLKSTGIPLTRFENNREGMITDMVFSDYGIFERIVSMGIFLGEKIKITNRISDTVIVSIGNKKIALNNDIAEGIRI